MQVQKMTINDPMEWYRRGNQQIVLADALDASAGAAMTVGFARYRAGESNDWTVTYDEALIITKGRFTVRAGDQSTSAGVGEVIYLYADTPLVYHAEQDTELVYVTYPHWMEATLGSPYAGKLAEFQPIAGADRG